MADWPLCCLTVGVKPSLKLECHGLVPIFRSVRYSPRTNIEFGLVAQYQNSLLATCLPVLHRIENGAAFTPLGTNIPSTEIPGEVVGRPFVLAGKILIPGL